MRQLKINKSITNRQSAALDKYLVEIGREELISTDEEVELAQRIIDFASGACYSLNGSLQKISSYIFVLGPSSVDITGDLQNILGGATPSVRAGY